MAPREADSDVLKKIISIAGEEKAQEIFKLFAGKEVVFPDSSEMCFDQEINLKEKDNQDGIERSQL